MSFISQKGQGGPLALQSNGTFQSINDANLQTLVGTRYDLSDGREVILVGTSSATTTTPGLIYQDAALIANHQGLTVTAVTPYGSSGGVANSANTPATVTVTLGGTAANLNQYQGGFLVVNTGAGIGQTLRISSNTGQTVTTGSVVLTLEDGPNVALTTGSTVGLVPSHGSNVIASPTAQTNVVTGVSLYPIAPSTYGYLLSKGVVGVVSDASAPTAGVSVAPSTVTASTLGAAKTTGGIVTNAVIGYSVQSATSGQASAFFVDL